MALTDLITVIAPDKDDDPEDIFASAPGLIFTDDLRNMHGDDASVLVYKSKRFGDIELRTADPEKEGDRKLFAHYLWNAGIKMAELISEEDAEWRVEGERVLELGAGVGLDGIVATLAGAQEVFITDYPSEVLLENIRRNVKKAIPDNLKSRYHIKGYEWGDVTSPFALESAHSFTRILAADCYWMPHEHENLVKSMLHLLSREPGARIFSIAGFHTGRAKLALFYQEAVAQGLEIESIYEEDSDGNRREWMEERDGGTENVTERKRWLVIAILKRRLKSTTYMLRGTASLRNRAAFNNAVFSFEKPLANSLLNEWISALSITKTDCTALYGTANGSTLKRQTVLQTLPVQTYGAMNDYLLCGYLHRVGRETTSPYKTLASSLRRLRNVLGDIDEALNDTNDPRGNDTKLQPPLSHSKITLEKLDMALVTFKCVNQADVDNEAVAGLKASIEDVTQELATIYEKLRRTEETSAPTCSCVLVRKASQGSKSSSSWSIVNRDVATDTNTPEPQKYPVLSADALRPYYTNVLCKTPAYRLQPSASDISLGGKSTASWRSFTLDPLSKPIDDATKIIMSSDSPTDSRPFDDLADSAPIAACCEDKQMDNGEASIGQAGQLWKRVDAVMNGAPPQKAPIRPKIVFPVLQLSTESTEDLYTATPPKKASLTNLKDSQDVSLYPDPLQLRKKLVRLDVESRPLHPTLHPRLDRYYANYRRNSVGALAELEGEPVHPPTRHIIHYWNDSSWDNAELYLTAHLNEINTGSHTPSFRRTQHLLGVCASFKGEWNEAIKRFIEVLHKPINKSSDLDDGDCAAAYWLGDLYAMQNRRADALLAYSVARHSSVFDDNALHSVLAADRISVRLGISKNEFKRHWSEATILTTEKGAAPSILSNDIISMEVVKSCLEGGTQEQRDEDHRDFTELVRARHLHAFLLKDNDKLGVRPELNERMAMKIDASCLDPDSPWPMPYDPLFCMANVQRGRLLAYECDMLSIFTANPEAKLPRPLSLKLDCFTCSDLTWLISTIRTCLTTYEIDHSEVVNIQGTWFCCRYSFMQHKIATTHYFSIALFKHPFRSSFGAEICSDEGMGSARIVETAGNYRNGVHYQEPKRIKRLIRKFLDEAARREQGQGRKVSISGMNVSGLPSQYDTT
ncbi:hypothetical protein PRZ48_001998 [Zasmidium cellare]|uniref:Uncharacterized protein n=1 Tax=Zasmidium cellare TaxID=395010 RepID=A0ABR0F4M5_ZASCE|nr:hypothetical protein PRZ48_001998 [Zasmidium cellare]